MLKSLEIILENELLDFWLIFQNVPICVPPQSSSIFWALTCAPPRSSSIFWALDFFKIDQIALNSPCKKKVRTTPFDQYFLGIGKNHSFYYYFLPLNWKGGNVV